MVTKKDKLENLKTKSKNNNNKIPRNLMSKKDWIRNPTGKGGFADNPQNRSDGSWRKETSFKYWLNYFKKLTQSEFESWLIETPKDEITVAARLAYQRVARSLDDLREFQEVANRTEGAPERITINNINAQQNNDYTDPSILADILKDVQKDIKLSNELKRTRDTNTNKHTAS